MKRYAFIYMIVLCLFIINQYGAINAKSLESEDQPRLGRVIEVIDLDVIKVWVYGSDFQKPKEELIKMIGIIGDTREEAFLFTRDSLLGKLVYITYDNYDGSFPELLHQELSYAYVYVSTYRSFSEGLLMKGYAVLDDRFYKAVQFNDLVEAEKAAMAQKEGTWKNPEAALVNINTVSKELLMETFSDIDSETADKVISYRSKNLFNQVYELKFADKFFNSQWLSENAEKLSVVTNIADANLTELMSLFSQFKDYGILAEDLMRYRTYHPMTSLSVLNNIPSIKPYYDQIKQFSALTYESLLIEKDKKVVNINLASKSQLINIGGLNTYMADRIVYYRENTDYIYKYPGELMVSGAPLDSVNELQYVDELSCYTDINRAGRYEIMSLFGIFGDLNDNTISSMTEYVINNRPYKDIYELKDIIGLYYYNGIKRFIYLDENSLDEYININSSDLSLVSNFIGMTAAEKTAYESYRLNNYYKLPTDIKFDYESVSGQISMFTNVNKASYYEIKSLHKRMSDKLVNAIIDLREQELIADKAEIKAVFDAHYLGSVFEEVEKFLIFY